MILFSVFQNRKQKSRMEIRVKSESIKDIVFLLPPLKVFFFFLFYFQIPPKSTRDSQILPLIYKWL